MSEHARESDDFNAAMVSVEGYPGGIALTHVEVPPVRLRVGVRNARQGGDLSRFRRSRRGRWGTPTMMFA